MRGSLCIHLHVAGSIGIIPAHAGLTSVCHVYTLLYGDHPRVCGAHTWDYEVIEPGAGSSPRMRGSLRTAGKHAHVSGIIPAYSGLTYVYTTLLPNEVDHPRVCGAHSTKQDGIG